MRRLMMFLPLLAVLLLVLPACGATKAQIDQAMEINQQKDVVAVSVMDHLGAVSDNAMRHADRTTPAGEKAYNFFADTKKALDAKRDDYARLTRLQVRMILTMQDIPDADKERYLDQLLQVIAAIKHEGGDGAGDQPVGEGGGS